jgi:integrase
MSPIYLGRTFDLNIRRMEGNSMARERGTGRIYKQKGCRLWSIQYYRNRKRIRESTGSPDEKVAKQKLRHRLQQIASGTYIGPQVERVKVGELSDAFFRDQRINQRKRPSVPKTRWEKHLAPFFSHRRVIDIGTDVLNEYIDHRISEGAKHATINREIAVLRRMFRLGYYANPQKVIRLPKFPKLIENNVRLGFIELDEYDELISHAPELWLRGMLEIYHTYGWRKSEVVGMRVRQVDFMGDLIRLEVGSTKNKEGREQPMNDIIRSLLLQCAQGKKPDDFLFTRENGRPVRDFRRSWQQLCIAAGLGVKLCRHCQAAVTGNVCESCGRRDLGYRGRILHDLRRTAARNMRRAGVTEGIIMATGGWKTRSVFERYNIKDNRDKIDALVKLDEARKRRFGHKVEHNTPPGDSQPGTPGSTVVN